MSAIALALLSTAMVAEATVGGKVLSGNDRLFYEEPFDAQRPVEVTRESNPLTFDSVFVFHPDLLHAREALRDGRLPVWSPLIGAGQPMLASQQGAPLYPLNLPLHVFPFWRTLGWVALLKLFTAALGTYALCRSLRLHYGAAALGGAAFGLGSGLVVWLAHPHVNSYILIPWLLLAVRAVVRRGGVVPVLGTAAIVGFMLLGGHPQSAFLGLLAAAGWAVFLLVGLPKRPVRLSRVSQLAGAGVFGLALAAVMLLPFLELVANSYRLSRGGPPVEPSVGVSFLFPEYWGRVDKYVLSGEPMNFTERTAYVGAVPLVLAVAGLWRGRLAGEQRFFLVLALVSFLAAVQGPVGELARQLPGLDSIGVSRALILVALAISMLGAYGLDALLRGAPDVRRRVWRAATLAAAVPLGWVVIGALDEGVWGQALGQLPEIEPVEPAGIRREAVHLASALRWGLYTAAFLVLAALALRALRSSRWQSLAVLVAALALTAGDLLPLNRGFQPAIDQAVADPPAPPAIRVLQEVPPQQRVTGDGRVGPNLALRYGFRDMRSHELPVIERRSRLHMALGGVGFQRTEWVGNERGSGRLLDVFNVSLVFSHRLWNENENPVRRQLQPLPGQPSGAGTQLWRNVNPLPRAWVAHTWRAADDLDAALAEVTRSERDEVLETPIVEGAPTGPPRDRVPDPAPALILSEGDVGIAMRIETVAPGMLILHDTYYPGWKAYVDGRETEILPANAAFRAVAVPAGRHKVRFAYEPASLRAGVVISSIGWLALVAGVSAHLRRRHGRRRRLDVVV